MKHSFGGEWTQEKLERISEYLIHYKIALKNQPFKLVYIDAFAGTGYINQKEDNFQPFLPEFAEEEVKEFIDGSTRIALQLENPFDTYIFIEKDKERVFELSKLKLEFPELADKIFPVKREANEYIQSLCEKDWLKSNRRAVMFLDPYGMQVKWETIEAIANTKAIDLWLLFPLGVAVNRLLRNDGQISPKIKQRLDDMFGTSEWQEFFFREDPQQDLFDQTPRLVKSVNLTGIAEYFNNRLNAMFEKVANNPLRLMNSRNNPLYLLCFASGNPKGAEPAVRIAQHILKEKK
ncbi:MAG: three-Cys-motif partner protein TcmP [Acidobacteria bacterium]|jgi:three-Cys-motif partner protein|nr:three-Cys-motif partner protein TcmP [Acidobacteriota bacterium]